MDLYIAKQDGRPYCAGFAEQQVKVQAVRQFFDIQRGYERVNERELWAFLESQKNFTITHLTIED